MDWSEVWSRGPLVDGLRMYGLTSDPVMRVWLKQSQPGVALINRTFTYLEEGALADLLYRVAPEGSFASAMLEASGVSEEQRTAAREQMHLDKRWPHVVNARMTKGEWNYVKKEQGT